jgi:peroxiredoxin
LSQKTFIAAIISIALYVPTSASATGRFSSGDPTSHPKTKGVPPSAGSHVPSVTMTDTTGRSFSFSSLRGRMVVLEWTNYECPYVSRHYDSGNMQSVQRQAIAAGATWITIFSSAPGKQGHLDARGADYFTTQKNAAPTFKVLDPSGNVGRAFGARTTPHMFVINGRGVITYAGAIDDQPRAIVAEGTLTRNYVLEAVSATARGQIPNVRTTPAYGCSIKY